MTQTWKSIAVLGMLILNTGCNSGPSCDSNQAMNKMLALNSVQARLVSKGGDGLSNFAATLAVESGPISELIGEQKFTEACIKADELAAKYQIDFKKEQEGMITIEQLTKDGGKGSGTCSIGDAAKKQMELHGLLQAEVDAGKKGTEVFQQFNEDTKGYAEMLTTNPSKACELLDNLKVKYEL